MVTGDTAVVLPAGADLPTSMSTLAGLGQPALDQLRAAAKDLPSVSVSELEFLPVVPRPGKVVAIGLNYVEHAAEGGFTPPPYPIVFAKFPSSVLAHGGVIAWNDELTSGVDYEAELAVVIGKAARQVDPADALSHVFGYTCLNDVSARDLQATDGQWVRAKSLDTFCPVGPWVVTADEIPDPQTLPIRCRVSGEVLQDANTADMIFSVRELIAHCSRSFTLEPGDVIATGTPPGVGWARDPRRVLCHDDVVEVEIGGIGSLRNTCQVEEPARASAPVG